MKSNRRGGLGRGLGALIPTGPLPSGPLSAGPGAVGSGPAGLASTGSAVATLEGAVGIVDPETPSSSADRMDLDSGLAPVPGARFAELPVNAIVANTKQPRQVFDEEAMDELKHSIQEVGLLQPVVVRDLGAGSYELVMGERRWRAAQALGRTTIAAIVRETRDDAMLRDALLENIHRANLNPLEEAAAYQQLLEEFGATHEELARRIGRSRPQISNTIRLLNLPAQVQRRVAAGVLSAGHARALLGLEQMEQQEGLAHRIVAEGLSVRATEELVALTLSEGGNTRTPTSTQRRPRAHAPALNDLADRLSDRFDTRVKVDIGRRKGKIVIEFATVDDLERIVGVFGLEEPPQRS